MKSLSYSRLARQLLALILFSLTTRLSMAADGLNLYVQPIASVAETERAFKPLADYLSEKVGQPVIVHTEINFLTYWERMLRGESFDLVLDAAHFTDYRVKHLDYEVLAKVPDTVSFSLVTDQNLLLLEPQELIGHTISTAASPSLGGVRLSEMFPNPMRQPTLVQANNFQTALDKLHKGEIRAALVPTPMVNNDNTVNTLLTTEPVPHMALSASPAVDAMTRKIVRQALLDAEKDPKGQAMLREMNYARFEPASNATYDGYAKLLSDVWSYQKKVGGITRR